ncbi:hypothetical protein DAI22_11g197100 [Oryza sativa Japonica Group]|nr:hypothetical protein DAI22_11g197100 [Oryza sativa Japonica Group]
MVAPPSESSTTRTPGGVRGPGLVRTSADPTLPSSSLILPVILPDVCVTWDGSVLVPSTQRNSRINTSNAEFNEQVVFEIPKDCISNDPLVTERNTKLVKFYEEIAQNRYQRYHLIEAGAGKKKLTKSWENLQTKLKTARTYQQDVRQVGGKAVPIPAHFTDEV